MVGTHTHTQYIRTCSQNGGDRCISGASCSGSRALLDGGVRERRRRRMRDESSRRGGGVSASRLTCSGCTWCAAALPPDRLTRGHPCTAPSVADTFRRAFPATVAAIGYKTSRRSTSTFSHVPAFIVVVLVVVISWTGQRSTHASRPPAAERLPADLPCR